jgi:hypothetical protein
VLELQGYDIILRCDWIYEYSSVGLNLNTREFTIEKQGQRITLIDETLPNKHFLVTHKKKKKLLRKGAVDAVLYIQALQMSPADNQPTIAIQYVLQEYKGVFEEPTELPPQRTIYHTIPLQAGAAIVNTRSYRLSHKQKKYNGRLST